MGLVDRWHLVAWWGGTLGWMILWNGVGVGMEVLASLS